MPENRDLSGGPPADVEHILKGLVPEPPIFDRDQFFFHAGVMAAGARGRSAALVWRAIAATLLVACGGLGLALHRQVHDLAVALGATGSASGVGGTAGRAPSAAADGRSSVHIENELAATDSMRAWQRLASPAPLPPGQLTARGWVELPPGEFDDARTRSDEQPSMSPRKPSTYLDLLRLQQEG